MPYGTGGDGTAGHHAGGDGTAGDRPVEGPALRPGPHGGDGRRVAAALGLDPAAVLDLSASLNPFAPDAAALLADRLHSDPGVLGAYPDDGRARDALAAAIGVDPDRVVLTNGGAEAIALVAALHPDGDVAEPEFSLYRRHLARVRPGAPRWRSNPSNPLGRLAAPADRAFVWDEAFHPLATGRWTRGDEGGWRLGSLTKLWACPGLRLGYGIAPDVAAARALAARRPRWSVSGPAAALLPDLLDRTDLTGWHDSLVALRRRLAIELRAVGLPTDETDAPWVLCRPAPTDRHTPTDRCTVDLRARLAPLGVIVRDCTSFGLPGTYRIALPHPADLDRVVAAVAAVLR